jgi:hypothetical protein
MSRCRRGIGHCARHLLCILEPPLIFRREAKMHMRDCYIGGGFRALALFSGALREIGLIISSDHDSSMLPQPAISSVTDETIIVV